MNDTMTDTFMPALTPNAGAPVMGFTRSAPGNGSRQIAAKTAKGVPDDIPDYLRRHYWWTYIHPLAVRLFERQWLVNAILWGNYARLRDAALASLDEALPGATLQVACAYGDLTTRLAKKSAAANGRLDVVDVLPIQLQNLANKLPPESAVQLLAMNTADLHLPDCSYDRALVFFLLHEQPAAVRRRSLREVLRVMKPGGRLVIVDYAQPCRWHPARYLWRLVLAAFEPFALDLWRSDVTAWMPAAGWRRAHTRRFFGGLYEMTTVTRDETATMARS
jgi:ubiquinone/menaquinone biosynthesis C-methylase UbiE